MIIDKNFLISTQAQNSKQFREKPIALAMSLMEKILRAYGFSTIARISLDCLVEVYMRKVANKYLNV